MARKIVWVTTFLVVCVLSIAGTYIVHQQNQIKRLTAKPSESQLVPTKTQTESATIVVEAPAITTPGQQQDTDQAVLDSLSKIEDMMVSIDERVKDLEEEIEIVRLDASGRAGQANEEIIDENLNDEFSPKALEIQEARNQYYSTMEQTIAQTADESFTQNVRSSFEEMVTSREEWSQSTSFKSAECGAEFCKVVLSYKQDVEPIVEFEFEAMAHFWNKDLGTSTTRFQGQPDGTTNLTMYFAKKGVELPLLP